MSLPSRSALRPDPEQKELWRFEVSVDHAPAFRRRKAPADRGQLQRCLPLPTFTTACHACAGERTALSRRPRRLRRPSTPWSGGGDLSAGSSHRSVQTSAYHLKGRISLYGRPGARPAPCLATTVPPTLMPRCAKLTSTHGPFTWHIESLHLLQKGRISQDAHFPSPRRPTCAPRGHHGAAYPHATLRQAHKHAWPLHLAH